MFKKPNEPYTAEWTRLSNKPMSQSRRNIFALVSGSMIGLWLGQHFPDVYFYQIEHHLPEIAALDQVKKDPLGLKPDPLPPRSNFDYPKNLEDMLVPPKKI